MLKLFTQCIYRNRIYTDELALFGKLYKWACGLYTLISLRRVIGAIIFYLIGITCIIFINLRIDGLVFIGLGICMYILEIKEIKKSTIFNIIGAKTPAQIRTMKIEEFIRRPVTTNGKALGKKEWKTIKKHDMGLYNDLLCDECDHCCYYYSLEIALIIKDAILIWGGVEEPFKQGHKYYAHAIILRNGYIYDSNMRQSIKSKDFVKLYKFKTYKQWNYEEYSQENFRESERTEFRKWCKENNVLGYKQF